MPADREMFDVRVSRVICLEANVVTAMLDDRPLSVRARLWKTLDDGERIAISAVVVFELRYGNDVEFRSRSAGSQSDGRRRDRFFARKRFMRECESDIRRHPSADL